MVHFRNFESGLLPTTLRKRKLQLLPRSAPERAPAFTLRREQKLELSLTFPAFQFCANPQKSHALRIDELIAG
jgi:hypothetical protein